VKIAALSGLGNRQLNEPEPVKHTPGEEQPQGVNADRHHHQRRGHCHSDPQASVVDSARHHQAATLPDSAAAIAALAPHSASEARLSYVSASVKSQYGRNIIQIISLKLQYISNSTSA